MLYSEKHSGMTSDPILPYFPICPGSQPGPGMWLGWTVGGEPNAENLQCLSLQSFHYFFQYFYLVTNSNIVFLWRDQSNIMVTIQYVLAIKSFSSFQEFVWTLAILLKRLQMMWTLSFFKILIHTNALLLYILSRLLSDSNSMGPWVHDFGLFPPYQPRLWYSMIIWNCQKVNYSNLALKHLPRPPSVPKVAYVWDILVFQAFGTSRSTGKYQDAYLWLETIEENWRKCTKIDPLRISFDTLTPQLYLRTLPNTLTYLKWFPMSPRNAPDHSYMLVRQLESQRVWISIKILQYWPMFSSCK